MGRKLFTLMSAISTLLCAAALALWAFSCTRAIAWDRYAGGRYQAVLSDRGRIVFATQPANPSVKTAWQVRSARPQDWGDPHFGIDEGAFGFGESALAWSPPGWGLRVVQRAWWVPHWFVAALTAVLPTIWASRRLRAALDKAIARRWPAVAEAPPMRRSLRLFTYAASICLVLALSTAALWVRSLSRVDYLRLGDPPRPLVIWSAGGRLIVSIGSAHTWGRRGWQWHSDPEYDGDPWERYIPGVAARKTGLGDFRYAEGSYPVAAAPGGPPRARERFRMVVFPMWLPAILLALPPAWWFPRRWRAFRARCRAGRNLCARCAYDLRGNTSGVCPECGMPAVQATTAVRRPPL
jgi:hypothetical protein